MSSVVTLSAAAFSLSSVAHPCFPGAVKLRLDGQTFHHERVHYLREASGKACEAHRIRYSSRNVRKLSEHLWKSWRWNMKGCTTPHAAIQIQWCPVSCASETLLLAYTLAETTGALGVAHPLRANRFRAIVHERLEAEQSLLLLSSTAAEIVPIPFSGGYFPQDWWELAKLHLCEEKTSS